MVVGSTCEETRLRLCENEGDYDYLIISEIVIPSEFSNRCNVPMMFQVLFYDQMKRVSNFVYVL
jgi:hypothetical protein